jgi:flagellar hook-associated protein 3 FlgL
MRISFQTGFRHALADIQRTSEELARRQREVSSGLRLQAPSDDPTAAVGAVTEHAALGAIDRYARAADSVGARLTVVDTVLSDIVEKLTQAQAVATGTLGDTPTAAQREAAARELAGLRDALFGDFNTNFRGVFVFAGTASTTSPYQRNPDQTIGAYQGNTSTIEVDIDRTSAVQVTFDASAIAQGGEPRDVFAVLETLRADILAADTPAIETGIADLKKAFDRAVRAQTQVGTDQKALEDQRLRLTDETLGAEARLSKLQDANMAEAISAMNRAQTGYQAALGATATITRVSLMDFLR